MPSHFHGRNTPTWPYFPVRSLLSLLHGYTHTHTHADSASLASYHRGVKGRTPPARRITQGMTASPGLAGVAKATAHCFQHTLLATPCLSESYDAVEQ